MSDQKEKPPERVMRFYGDLDYALETIAHREIVLVRPELFNDPFDPYVEFDTDFHERYNWLKSYVESNHEKQAEEFFRKLPEEQWLVFLGEARKSFKKLKDDMFVFSTANIGKDDPEWLHMWAHYGKGHHGIALEFDTGLLAQSGQGKQQSYLGKTNPKGNLFLPVDYQKNINKITCEDIFNFAMSIDEDGNRIKQENAMARKIDSMIRTKSTTWDREKEWRLIWWDEKEKRDDIKLSLQQNSIIGIYFGCRMDERKHKEFIVEAKKSFPNAKIYLSQKRIGEFALDSMPLN